MPHERFIGPYRIDEVLGHGGVATVYKAYHKALERTVAVKVISAPLGTDPDFIQRLRLEARTIARLRHPNILSVHDFGELSDLTYIVTEFVSGGTLASRVKAPLRLDVVARLLKGIAAGLDYAHGEGIIHRDIKPSNILLAADDTPVIADFGLAKVMGGGGELTRIGAVMGTPEYMSPEQAMAKPLDARADVYSLGVVLYEMLTGSVPFESETPLATLLAHVHTPVPLPSVRVPALPAGVEAVVIKALAKEADDRYTSAGELARALASALESAANSLPSSGMPILDSPQEVSVSAGSPIAPIGRGGEKRAMWPWFILAPVGIAAMVAGLVLSRGSEDIRGSGPVSTAISTSIAAPGGERAEGPLLLSVPTDTLTPTATVTPTEEPMPSAADAPTAAPSPSPQPTATVLTAAPTQPLVATAVPTQPPAVTQPPIPSATDEPTAAAPPSPQPTATVLTAVPTQPPAATQPPLVSEPNTAEAQLLALYNRSRADAGLRQLEWDPAAAAAAQGHVKDMVARGFYDLKNPEGVGPIERLRASGITFPYSAQNINAGSSVVAIHSADMGGESNRRNILDPRVTRVGIGIAARPDRMLLMASVFIQP